MEDKDALKHLGQSIGCVGLLMACASYTVRITAGIEVTREGPDLNYGGVVALRWASWVILVAGLYGMQGELWRRCVGREEDRELGQSSYAEVPVGEGVKSEAESSESSESTSGVKRPEMAMTEIWVYVYGWGAMLFVCVYCMAGIDLRSSCWWVIGMLALSLDELIMRNMGRMFIGFIVLFVTISVTAVWWTVSGARAASKELDLGEFCIGIIFPVVAPFIFFSLRCTVRMVERDVGRLCKIAMPFMMIIAVGVMMMSPLMRQLVVIEKNETRVSREPLLAKVENESLEAMKRWSQRDKYNEYYNEYFKVNETIGFKSGFKLRTRPKRPSKKGPIHVIAQNKSNVTVLNASYRITIPMIIGANSTQLHNIQTIQTIQTIQSIQGHNKTLFNSTEALLEFYSDVRVAVREGGVHVAMMALYCITPIVAMWTIAELVACVVHGFATEFLAAFMLMLAVKVGVSNEYSTATLATVGAAGMAFLCVLITRK